MALDSEPTADVSIGVSSSDTGEGTVAPATLTFTTGNWNTAQTVTVTGVDDAVDDDDQTYSIVLAAATSTDANYSGFNPDDVSVTNTDDDAAGVTVTLPQGETSLTTTEAGGEATFTVALDSAPTADVSIGVSSDDLTEGTVEPATLTFTTGNWNTAQTVTVTGVDDDVDDGDQDYTIVLAAATSTDANYSGFNPDDVSVTNTDDDAAGVTVTLPQGLSSLTTTEAGGEATFTVALDSAPTADVSIGVSSSDTGEGTVAPATLTFTTGNWNTAQTVTVTGVDDNVDDDDQDYTIVLAAATSTDANYSGADPDDVSVVNEDDDTAGIAVTLPQGETSLTTTEAGGEATFTVALDSAPTADVSIGVSSSDTGEGTVAPATLTFTTGNWNTAQTVTVTGVDDDVDDDDQDYTIVLEAATSTDTNYSGADPGDVSVVNEDDDTAGFTVTPITAPITTEGGGTARFTVALGSAPTADVSIGVSSSDTGEGTVEPATLTFTTGNWNTAQTVTVTGVDDAVDDGDQSYTIVLAAATSTDTNYSGADPGDVSVVNEDDDAAGITVTLPQGLSSLTTTEAGGEATFTVALDSAPTADVSIGVSSDDLTEGTVAPATLTFTTGNWNTAQTVTVTGVDDAVDDGDRSYTIKLAAAESTDTNYGGADPDDVSVTNTDDDAAGVTVTLPQGLSSLTTTEAGGEATFTVALDSAPTADASTGVSSDDLTEGTVAPATLTFTTGNWNTAQTVTVTGVDDAVDDGDQGYTIVLAAATSTDTNYGGTDPDDVSVTNTDDDTAGIAVTLPQGETSLTTTEAGGEATFTVALDSAPTADVSIGVSSDDTTEGTVAPATLTFTTGNWNTAQTVTVTGVDDAVDDGDQGYTIVLAAATSTDANYGGTDPGDVSVTNTDDDAAGITVTLPQGLTSLTTTEAGGEATFTVALDSVPTADVSIAVSSDDTGEGTVAPASLEFTPDNWNTAQTVTVTGVDDAVDDGDQGYTIVLAAAPTPAT